ncbi:SMP-30/gluconolactonase/LRE family protein [Catenovulum sediminis]|uniref:SMP-30/gluconolactonase/LRE family protein n=1 Tax=Catenovulum sediminis TaxID=1740262 RepID=A0ABV1RIN5_9ALTE
MSKKIKIALLLTSAFWITQLTGCRLTANQENAHQPNQQTQKTTKTLKTEQGIYQIYDDEALLYLDLEQSYEALANGFEWVEGPAWISANTAGGEQGGYLIFSDIPNNKIYQYHPKNGLAEYLMPSGFSNGLLINHQNELVIMQSRSRQVVKMYAPLNHPTTEYNVLASHYRGKRLNSPNDSAIHKNGTIYFSDPPYGLPKQMDDPAKELDFQGVFQLKPTGELKVLDDSISFPNGVAISPDNQFLYVAVSDPKAPKWYQFKLDKQGEAIEKKLFYKPKARGTNDHGAPDGLKVHSSGVVFATGPEGVWLFNPDGKVLAKIKVPHFCANLAFDENEKNLYITAHKKLLRIKLRG